MNELTTQQRNPDPATALRKLINSPYMRQQMAMSLPQHLTPDRMVRCALTALLKNPTLLKADQSSFTLALLNLSQWGLEPDGRRAHLVPFWNTKANRYDVVAIPDYKGLAELVLDGGNVSGIHCDVVCENDDFDFNLGSIVKHRIDFRKPRGEPYAAYALIVLKEGQPKAEIMTREEIEKIRDNSQGWRAFKAGKVHSSVWQEYPYEMWKKTVFKRATKWLKLGSRAQQAVEADDAIEARGQVLAPISLESPTVDVEPVAQVEDSAEEQAQADAGMAPARQAVTRKPREVKLPPQKEMQNFVESNGYTFDQFIMLAEQEEWLADPSTFPDWDSLPTAEIKRLLRATDGLLAGLKQLVEQNGGAQ